MTVLRGAGPTGPGRDAPTGAVDVGQGSGGRGTADGTAGGYDERWLDLRADADTRSRSVDLLDRLVGLTGRDDPHLLDLGCGGGAMQRWCAARLGGGARWTLMDPDEQLLRLAAERAGADVATRRGRVLDLVPAVLADVDAVVCSALLDVLPATQLEHLAEVLAEAGVPMLAALTVTGEVTLRPGHARDAVAGDAVHRTATADGATGPAALPMLRSAARAHGLVVLERATPWLLDPDRDGDLLRAWAEGYVAAAVAGAGSPEVVSGWAEHRLREVAAGSLAADVVHADVLVAPS